MTTEKRSHNHRWKQNTISVTSGNARQEDHVFCSEASAPSQISLQNIISKFQGRLKVMGNCTGKETQIYVSASVFTSLSLRLRSFFPISAFILFSLALKYHSTNLKNVYFFPMEKNKWLLFFTYTIIFDTGNYPKTNEWDQLMQREREGKLKVQEKLEEPQKYCQHWCRRGTHCCLCAKCVKTVCPHATNTT